MSKDFASNWEKKDSASATDRLKEAIRPPGPLKPRIEAAQRSLQMQVQRLDQINSRLIERQRVMFEKVVEAIRRHDQARATIYANEVAEIRKMAKLIMQSRLALESIIIRLGTLEDLGDVITNLAPAISVVSSIRKSIGQVTPEADKEMGEISNLLSSILVEAGQSGNYTVSFDTANEDAQKILEEAAALAETKLKEQFPDLPTAASSQQTRQ